MTRRRIPAPTGAVLVLALAGLLIGPLHAQEVPFSPAERAALGAAVDQVRSGAYEEGISALRGLARAPDAPVVVLDTYARALMEVGRYRDALRVLEGEGERASKPGLENVLGEAHRALGQLVEAEAAFRRAVESGAPDRHLARLNLAILLWDRGDRDEALALFDTFIDLYNGSRARLSAEELMAVGTAVRYLGVRNPDLYQDALMAFDNALEVDPQDPRPDILAGELLLEKYDATEARESFKPVLDRNPRQPRALLGQARILDFEGVGGSIELVRQALEVNPQYADAWAFLASLRLKTEDYRQAREDAQKALAVNPVHMGALSVLAAAHFLEGEATAYEEVRRRVLALNPRYADLYTTVAEHAVSQRQYQEAVELAQAAVALDSTSWWSYGVLGINQLRTGAMQEGRRNLETAFAGDPQNPWYFNTLELLDSFARFERIRTEHFEIFLDPSESELLGPYAAELAEESFAALRARYGVTPPTPVRLEIYPRHSDFSVRTLGIPGLGALGVSFGSTLVMDSPSALDAGDFNWASTMWHEIAHAFHLAMSDHRVPRWFTEGLAVHEQHRARVGWGLKASPGWLQAYASGRLHPVSRLNDGFVRPDYPEQVVFSYYQASLVFELIEDRWGPESVLAMLAGYRAGKENTEVFRDVLGVTPEAFDRIFDEHVQARWGDRIRAVTTMKPEETAHITLTGARDLQSLQRAALENPGSFQARLRYGQALFREERMEEAEVELREALRLFPEYGEVDSPYRFLAEIHRERGELEQAARALHRLGSLGETLHPIHLEEAGLWLEVGDTAAAAEALEMAVELVPFDLDTYQQLAELHERLGDSRAEVQSRRAVLALGPVDRAEAHYRLALALTRAGEREEARSEVLRALEIAPTYDPALELLLRLRGGIGDNEPESLRSGLRFRAPGPWEAP